MGDMGCNPMGIGATPILHSSSIGWDCGILYRMSTIHTGRIGEAAIIAEFVEQGFDIYCPIFGNADFDLVVAREGQVLRVEVKTTAYEKFPNKYEVQLRSVRHNTKTTVTKKFDGKKSDILAIYIIPTKRVVFLDSMQYDGRNSVIMDGTAPACEQGLNPWEG